MRGIRLRRVVVNGANYNAASPWSSMRQRRTLQAALLVASLQVFHLAAVPVGNPAREVFQLGSVIDWSYTRQIETRVCSGLRYRGRDFSEANHGRKGLKQSLTCADGRSCGSKLELLFTFFDCRGILLTTSAYKLFFTESRNLRCAFSEFL